MVATAQNNKQKEHKHNEDIRAKVFGANIGPKPEAKPETDVEESGLAFAERTMRKPTKAMARALIIGDVIEAYYNDDVKPVLHVVVQPCESDEDIYRVRTVSKDAWNSGKKCRGPHSLNTDYWKKVGTMKFAFDPIV